MADAVPRSDESRRERREPSRHTLSSVLSSLKVVVVGSSVPILYQNLGCLKCYPLSNRNTPYISSRIGGFPFIWRGRQLRLACSTSNAANKWSHACSKTCRFASYCGVVQNNASRTGGVVSLKLSGNENTTHEAGASRTHYDTAIAASSRRLAMKQAPLRARLSPLVL